jgi:hypothetical protein
LTLDSGFLDVRIPQDNLFLSEERKVEDVCRHLMTTGLVSYKDVSISSLAIRDELS